VFSQTDGTGENVTFTWTVVGSTFDQPIVYSSVYCPRCRTLWYTKEPEGFTACINCVYELWVMIPRTR
jgi:hypothetical protein